VSDGTAALASVALGCLAGAVWAATEGAWLAAGWAGLCAAGYAVVAWAAWTD
jgi:hypothetical protein